MLLCDLSIKLNRANALFFKMRKYYNFEILRSISFAVLTTTYPTVVLFGLRIVALFNKLQFYKKKVVKIIIFRPRNIHISPLFKQNSILKFQDKICLENILFFSKSLISLSPCAFNTWFTFFSDKHNYEISSSTHGNHIQHFFIFSKCKCC